MAAIDLVVVGAVLRKELRNYLSNPTSYVFVTLFIAATAAAAFVQAEFFTRNLADLALLSEFMPVILMFFIPALTMSAWADERRYGTDELLLTLPVRDSEVILGKYLGALSMYTVALLFSLAHLIVLAYLGDPDPGLILSTYLGYWFMGALLCAIGLLASMLAGQPTGGFVLAVLGSAGVVFAASAGSGILGICVFALMFALFWLVLRGQAGGWGLAAVAGGLVGMGFWLFELWPGFEQTFARLSLDGHVRSFSEGVIRAGDICYFIGGAAVFLYLSGLLLGRRHW
jgi:ABC-type transport system involved in multi-copper enzyme maturation permease subunit